MPTSTRLAPAFAPVPALALLALFPVLFPVPSGAQVVCELVQVTDVVPGTARHPSLDGGWIAFESDADLTGGNPDGNTEIFLFDGVSIRQITESVRDEFETAGEAPPPGADTYGESLPVGAFAPSLDGGWIAFESNVDLTGQNPDGNTEIFLFDGVSVRQITHSTVGRSSDPSLDAGRIAFASSADLTGGNPDHNSEIFLFDGSTLHQVTDSADPWRGGSSLPSLDGESIAFQSFADLTGENPEGHGEIFLFDGMSLTQITHTPEGAFGWTSHPSLDGGAVAFDSSVDLTGHNPDGFTEVFLFDGASVRQITHGDRRISSHPSLDRGVVAFGSNADLTGENPQGVGGVFLYDGAGFTQIALGSLPSEGSPSLDGGSLAFVAYGDLTGGNLHGSNEVFLFDGRAITQVTDTDAFADSERPSLDGGVIAFQSDGDLTGTKPAARAIFRFDGSGLRQVTHFPAGESSEPSLDGGVIAFSSKADPVGENPDGEAEIFLFDGASFTQVTHSVFRTSTSPSLDGTSVAFRSDADPTGDNPDGSPEIFLHDGTTIRQITRSSEGRSLAPSLDGGAVAFQSDADLTGDNPDGTFEIFLWNGSSIAQITDSPTGDSTAPSLEGGAVAFVSAADPTGENPDGNGEIFLWDGATVTQITRSTEGSSHEPSLQVVRDSAWIAFSSEADLTGDNPDGNREIFLFDGSSITQVTHSTRGFSRRPSLDGRSIAFESTAPLEGGNADGSSEIFLARCVPAPPPGPSLTSAALPGFRFQVRITAADRTIAARPEADCTPETLCVSGALPGRAEVLLRVIGPRPNGFLWLEIVRFTPSRVEVWAEQIHSGTLRYHDLPALSRADTELTGVVDREAFSAAR